MFFIKFNLLPLFFTIIASINIKCAITINVNFHYNYNLKVNKFNTKIRETESQGLDEENAFYNFHGFDSVYSIPLVHPVDICVMNMERVKYAAALHAGPRGIRHFIVFEINNNSYIELANIPQPNAISLDCHTFNAKGYVALTLNIFKHMQFANESSTVYEVSGGHVRPIQYLTTPNMVRMYLWQSGEYFLMLQTFGNTNATHQTFCPYFIWSGESFSRLGTITCGVVRNVATFEIEGENFIALANEANSRRNIESNIFKFNRVTRQLHLFQSISKGANDVQYFTLKTKENKLQHYLVFVVSFQNYEQFGNDTEKLHHEAIVYYLNKSRFDVFNILRFKGIKQLLTFKHSEANKVLLLATLKDKTAKLFTFGGEEFIEYPVPLTPEAMGPGISNMRSFQGNNQTYLIVANHNMVGNKTNVFLPRYKQDKITNSLREQMVRWVEAESKKLKEIDVQDLNAKIEKKLQILDEYGFKPKRDLESSNINSVITENLIYPKMKMSTNYWTALYYINQALELLEQQLQRKYQLERSKRNANQDHSNDNLEYIYDSLNVDTLTVNKELRTENVNKINVDSPEFLQINAKKIVIKNGTPKSLTSERFTKTEQDMQQDIEIISIDHLQLNSKLNDITWNDLLRNTLKRRADIQFVKSHTVIRNLESEHLVATSNEISGQVLGALIPIDGGEYVINQDIQFAAPIKAKNVHIHERLNNVHVLKGKFDVLLKKANETQIIGGAKKLNNIKVMEPVTIAGQLLGKPLQSIMPDKAIHDSLTLVGDFVINGNVAINNEIKASDIIDLRAKMSVKQTLERGIRMDQPLTDVNLKFLHPLSANSSKATFVNLNDLQSLVKLNLDEIQIVEGKKIFDKSLEIRRGFSEVKNLNEVDIEKLERNAFLKHTNQAIKVPMKFGRIQANSIESVSILLRDSNVTDFLTKTGNQTIQGNLVVNNLTANTLNVENLNTNNRIFHQHLFDIYQQKSRNSPKEEVFRESRKFHGSIYVQNLIVNSTINHRRVEEIENNLLQLEGNIKYVGNFKFNYPLNVKGLKFHGMLNDINAKDFGKCWLQKKWQAQQNFLGPQTIARLKAEKGVHFLGHMNNITTDDFFTKTYWINRNEHLFSIMFENPIEMSAGLKCSLINSQFIANDLIHYSNSIQFFETLVIDENLEVLGHLSNVSTVNHINLHALHDLLNFGNADTLFVENVYFAHRPPVYESLNRRNISQILDSVWLTNENVVLPPNVMNDAYFEGLFVFKGPLNNMSLKFLQQNYLSKSKTQDISVEIIFDGNVTCENSVKSSKIELFAAITEGKSKMPFNFMEFVHNTLKTSGNHNISGNWSILEAIVDGDLNQVMVNDLNFINDIVLSTKTSKPFDVKATKLFKSATIENLLSNPSGRLNNVAVTNWINDAVYLYENYTIHGTTTIESLNVYNDFIVTQNLNNVSFNENTLFLQDRGQTLSGNLRITSHLVNKQRFLTNNIENLYADFINSEHLAGFVETRMPITKNLKLKSSVIFKEILQVINYKDFSQETFTPDQTLSIKRSLQHKLSTDSNNTDRPKDIKLWDFKPVQKYLWMVATAPLYAVHYLELRQSFKVNVSQINMFCLKTPKDLVDILAVVENPTEKLILYQWSTENTMFEKYEDFDLPALNPMVLNIVQKLYELIQEPLDVEYVKEVTSNVHNIVNTPKDLFYQVEFLNETCFILYETHQQKSNEFKIHCFDFNNKQLRQEFRGFASSDILQLRSLNSNCFVVLTNSSLEVWMFSTDKASLLQKMPLISPKEMSVKVFKEIQFIAVLTENSDTSLHQGTIEIFRSLNRSEFHLWQSLSISSPIGAELIHISESQDLCLHALSKDKSLSVYQYQGVMGFQEIIADSVLPPKSTKIRTFEIKSSPQPVVALVGEDQMSLLNIILRRI